MAGARRLACVCTSGLPARSHLSYHFHPLRFQKDALSYAYADKSGELKKKVMKLLREDQFTSNLGWMKLFDDLRESMMAEGKRIGTETMKPYFDEERLGEKLGLLHVGLPMHADEGKPPMASFSSSTKNWQAHWEVKTQEAFVRRPLLDGTNNTLDLQPDSFESEAVYVHVLRMVAMAIDADFQEVVEKLAVQHQGVRRGVPIKGTARMWNKLQAADDHRYLTNDQKAVGMARRSGQNIDINRCAVTFKEIDSFKVRCRRGGKPCRPTLFLGGKGGNCMVWLNFTTYLHTQIPFCHHRTLSKRPPNRLTASREQRTCSLLVKKRQRSSCIIERL